MAVTAPALVDPPRLGFEELYAAHQPRVYRTCLAILRNHDDAAEATQEVFSRALPLLTGLREPQVWLTTVARNYCFDQLRRQKVRGAGAALDEETPGSRRDDPEREALLRDALRQAFEALSGRERRALARVLLMDDSLADIAAMLGVSYGAAAQVVSRARRRAALAARAVIGASFGWLLRLAWPRERSDRVTRLAAQAVESGQQVLIAAVVVLGAGGLSHAEAVAPTSVAPPTVVHIAPAAARTDAVAADDGAGVAVAAPRVTVSPPLPPLPGSDGLPAVKAEPNHNADLPSGHGNPAAPGPVSVAVQPIYDPGAECAGAAVQTGALDRTLVACAPH